MPDGSMLITEKDGRIIHFAKGVKTEITGGPEVYLRGQGGLLDIELDPKYSENGWIYMSYSSAEGEEKGGMTAIMRCKLRDGQIVESEQLYKGSPNTKKPYHFGSRIEFDNNGYLYFSIGDRGNRDENPQDITRDGGKIYRINSDGSIPKDNPFYNEPNAKKAIYSFGHRNPQGMVKHPKTGEIWVHEHGPRGGDEINIIKPGVNFGWPKTSYGINYAGTTFTDDKTLPGIEESFHTWVPSIAPSGMCFVTSDVYPEWKGNLLAGSLVFQYLERLEVSDNEVTKREKLMTDIGRIRNVRQGPDGFIYVAVEGKGIYKLVPTS
jgi:glucose/arabinose dehydrogenase